MKRLLKGEALKGYDERVGLGDGGYESMMCTGWGSFGIVWASIGGKGRGEGVG